MALPSFWAWAILSALSDSPWVGSKRRSITKPGAKAEGFLFGRISPLNSPEYVIYIKNGDRYNAELALRMIVKDMGV